MRKKISISVSPKTLTKIAKALKKGYFRNTSHAFEYAINKILEVNKNEPR